MYSFCRAVEIEKQGDLEAAIKAYVYLAESGEIEAIQKLVTIYMNENCSFYDMNKGIKWLKAGRRADDIFCTTSLAYCYLLGNGVNQNTDIAMQLYLQAAENGDSDSQVVIAQYYIDVKKDYSNYCFWISKAIKDNNEFAIRYHLDLLNSFEKKLEDDRIKLETLKREAELNQRKIEYQKIQKRLKCSFNEITKIIYEKKLQNKVHFWRAR